MIIYVSSQAVKGAQRSGFSRFRAQAREAIVDEVRAALVGGRVSGSIPSGFRLGRDLDPWERFVWNPDRSRVWVIREVGGETDAVTTLVRKLLTRRETVAA